MTPLAKKCIESWKKYLPDYEIVEWNESNFDLDFSPYVREACEHKKYAFVADVCRLYALYTKGGIYMDTDVEVIKSFDPFLHHTAFSGYEKDKVTTGIMASEKGGKWAYDNLQYYVGRHFVMPDGSLDMTVNVCAIGDYMKGVGFRGDNTFQDFPGLITVYPRDYFCPKSYYTGEIHLTENTVVIHHFEGSWHSPWEKFKFKVHKKLDSKLYRILVDSAKKIIRK